jgi:hypothetical protein
VGLTRARSPAPGHLLFVSTALYNRLLGLLTRPKLWYPHQTLFAVTGN